MEVTFRAFIRNVNPDQVIKRSMTNNSHFSEVRHDINWFNTFGFFLAAAKSPTECRAHFKTALLRLLPGRFVPRCEADGSYDETQCIGSICLCVDERGIAIPGTSKPRFIKSNCESQGEK